MKIKLDHLGQFYSAVTSEKNPGTFSVSVYLNERLVPETLQQAVNGLVRRLPHFNVRKYSGFMHYYNEVLDEPLTIEAENSELEPCRYFAKGSHLLRVVYGERHFTLEVLHSVCDGRSLAMAAGSLLLRYFEIMGAKPSKEGFIDCEGESFEEETEDAYARYADSRKIKSEKAADVYVPKYKPAAARVKQYMFDLAELKPRAKALGVTITEYIMAHIFAEFAKQRAEEGCNKPITINVPIDCRGFFPNKSLCPFVSHKIVKMPESPGFAEMARGIKEQLAEITPDYIQGKISEAERLIRLGRFVPLFIKKWIIRAVGNSMSAGCSTGFSNLGLINLPEEVRDRVKMYSFALGAEPNMPYQFACVAAGGTLTLTATVTAEDAGIVDRIAGALLRQA